MSIKAALALVPLLLSHCLCPCLLTQAPLPAQKLPVREVTVFKDGHAYVVREAALPEGTSQVVLDELPAPVLGTFWPYASDGARLVSARAGREVVASDVAVTDVRQIALVNTGKQVVVVTHGGERIEGTLLGVSSRQPEQGANDGLLLLQTENGTRALPIGQMRDLEVRGEFTGKIRSQESRERLTLTVTGGGPGAKVDLEINAAIDVRARRDLALLLAVRPSAYGLSWPARKPT